jgi:two-component system nitrate/nitrite response regulator NarL
VEGEYADDGGAEQLSDRPEAHPYDAPRLPEVLGPDSDKVAVVPLRRVARRPTASESSRKPQQQLTPTLIIHENAVLRYGLESMLSKSRFFVKESAACLQNVPDETISICVLGVGKTGKDISGELSLLKAHHIPVVIVGESYQPQDVLSLTAAGVSGYLLEHSITPNILVNSLELVLEDTLILPRNSLALAGDTVVQKQTASPSEDVLNGPQSISLDISISLTNKEQIVLEFLTRGYSNKTIARELGLSEATVKTHVKRLLAKIKAKNRTQAAMWAVQNFGVDESKQNR